ncbi:MAG: hypothetical protein JWM72_448 [Actinomycetia bacterium]|jgi:hypothetical protein|nr:hypothetical protein [Actinomycetes bacterium]
MYLFSRRARLAPGNTRAAMAWATDITEKASQVGGLPLSLYAQVFSPMVGTIVWSTFVPDLAALEAATDKLNADDGFISQSDAGTKFVLADEDDSLLQVVYGEPDANRPVEYVGTVQSVCATGNLTKGLELGVEIAQRAEKTAGIPTMFVAGTTGAYGMVGWVSGYADIKEFETAQQKLAADTKFGEFVDKSVRGVYSEEPAATSQLMYRRIV